jgi:hypothetical protein
MDYDIMKDRNHEKFIMNNQRFLSIINQLRNNNSALEEYDETPHDTANNIVALGGWQFKISKTIYPLATINEILDGWNELIDDGIPVDLLFLTLFVRTILDDTCNTEALEEEPELVELVRLCYWYKKCSIINSQSMFFHKGDEIKEELGNGVYNKMEKYKLPLRADFGSNITQYQSELQPVLYAIVQRKAPKGFVKELEDIRHFIYGFVSECMFYSLASADFNISFNEKKPNSKNPDVFINRIPSEVKTIIDEIHYQDQIEANLIEEILCSLRRNKLIGKINEGLEQTARIIILDSTGTSLGYAINLHVSQHKKMYSIKEAINNAIELVDSRHKPYVPVVIFGQSVDLEYHFRFSAITVPCPVKTIDDGSFEVDVSKFPDKKPE